MRIVAIVVLVLVFGLVGTWLNFTAQNHPWAVAIVGGVVLLAAALVRFLYPSGALTLLVAFVGAAWLFGLLSGLDAREKELAWYCKYGAKSQAQVDECMRSVDTGDIDDLDTPAARFARGERIVCGPGSGPFCAAAAKDVAFEHED